MASDIRAPVKGREKVVLKAGFHLTDWMRLVGSSQDLSGRDGPLRNISKAELRQHNKVDDCWTVYNGKVYNITRYMQYHPGGVDKLMLGAGKDCTAMFEKYHRWVNAHAMIGKCLVGNLVDASPDDVIQEDHEGEEEAAAEDEAAAKAVSAAASDNSNTR